MSSMLEQAIIDAAALREAAIKNAEQAVIEKYAPEVKAAVNALLENDAPSFTRGQSVTYEGRPATVTVESDEGQVGIQEENGKTYLVNETELAEESGAALNEEEPAEENKDQLEEESDIPAASVDLSNSGLEEGEQVVFEFTASDFLQEDALDDMGAEEKIATQAAQSQTTQPEGGDEDTGPDDSVLNLTEEEDNLEEKTIQELVSILNELSEDEETLEEELVVDMAGEHKDGTFQSDEAYLKYYQEMELARKEATKYKEENEELNKKLEELDESQNKISKMNDKLTSIVQDLNEKLQSTLLSNAKLLYSNRALNDASLNERQKTKIVEAINKAQSVEEAKTLHETLRVTVGQHNKKSPQSLNETVQRKSNLSSMLNTKKQDPVNHDSFNERMRRLAGIK